ncbi:hypothetical protein JCGZ_10613 [Jatropha curcas]|uniref:Uncharacterized protein n=1 Tax=Jatropha curcas TaxID=180498 RepID=A0A067LQQ0_JATCU|nr:hypothetical protein JCGZ_10613 [Jatropha curcas]
MNGFDTLVDLECHFGQIDSEMLLSEVVLWTVRGGIRCATWDGFRVCHLGQLQWMNGYDTLVNPVRHFGCLDSEMLISKVVQKDGKRWNEICHLGRLPGYATWDGFNR